MNITEVMIEQGAIGLDKVMEHLNSGSNIGTIGRGVDFSDNELATELQNQFPLLTWLMGTGPAAKMRGAYQNGSLPMRKNDEGDWTIRLPFKVGTTPPQDTSGECCWVPMELTKCGAETLIKLLCLKDCESMLDNFIMKKQKFQPNDLICYFMRAGETIKAARIRMARMSMAWFTAHNIILGTTDTGTAVLKPFHGLMQVIEDPAVIKISGHNILAAFDSLACRYAVLGEGDIVYAVHPLTYYSIKREIVPGKNGQLPAGWAKNGEDVTFHGHRFIADKMVPVDVDNATGEIWQLDGNVVGAWMATTLQPSDEFQRHTFTTNNNQVEGCAGECDYYYNFGLAFGTDPNRLAVITDVPLSTNCVGPHMLGTEHLYQPDTFVPIVKE